MKTKYRKTLGNAGAVGDSLLNAMLEQQVKYGYLTEDAIKSLSAEFSLSETQVYEAASYYTMLRFRPPSEFNIQICRGAPCHVAGATDVITALEALLGIRMGETTVDGKYSLSYTECIGQCQASPSMLVNGVLYLELTPEKVRKLVEEGGF